MDIVSIEELKRQAILEVQQNFDGFFVGDSLPIIKDLAYLIATYVIKDSRDFIPEYVDYDMLINHLRTQAGIKINDELSLSSELNKRLIKHNIIAATILKRWNPIIPPLLLESFENIQLFDLSSYSTYYSQDAEILLINYDDRNIGVIEYNTSSRTMSKGELISDLIIRRLFLPVSSTLFEESKLQNLLEITSYLGLSRQFLAASMVQLLECPPRQMDARKFLVERKEYVLQEFFQLLNIDTSLVPKAIQIHQLFNDTHAVEHILKEHTYLAEPLPELI